MAECGLFGGSGEWEGGCGGARSLVRLCAILLVVCFLQMERMAEGVVDVGGAVRWIL